uniref:Uncharacterized protein n=1 Tax=Nelumbo nucifera TaxID=4432 RepID=A0A822ZT12_NELNU|nr:TPA_asm: hypothetical protein HUJ06_003228 [Nelumbo nucifera]
MFFNTKPFPPVVLKEMMKQSFFQDVLKRGKWKRRKDLQRIVLYDTVNSQSPIPSPYRR